MGAEEGQQPFAGLGAGEGGLGAGGWRMILKEGGRMYRQGKSCKMADEFKSVGCNSVGRNSS